MAKRYYKKRTNYGKSLSKTKYKRKGTSGIVTTTQYDAKTQYIKKRMPRRQRARWKKFVYKTRAVTNKSKGTKTVVQNSSCTAGTFSTAQNWCAAHLYAKGNAVGIGYESGNNDISNIENGDANIEGNTKVMFKSAVLDITLRNVSTTYGMECDIYDMVYGRDSRSPSLGDLFTAAQNVTPTITPDGGWAYNNPLTITSRGTTPFDLPELIKNNKIKILSKRKVFLPAGATTTYQIRDPKNRILKGLDWQDNVGYIIPGVTRTVLAVFKSLTGDTIVAPANPLSLMMGVTRKYSYVLDQDANDQDNYMSAQ